MPTYVVQWKYASSYGGPWVAGDEADIDEDVAAMINRDSPGVLALADTPQAAGWRHRMVTQASTPAPANFGAMTTETNAARLPEDSRRPERVRKARKEKE